jgi:hypothetical protein
MNELFEFLRMNAALTVSVFVRIPAIVTDDSGES